MTSRKLRARLREYGATVSRDGRSLKLAANPAGTGGPAVEYRVALDGTISRRTPPDGRWELVAVDEMERGVLAIWLTEPISLRASGRWDVIDGTPVPYSMTVRARGKADKEQAEERVRLILREKGMREVRREGKYVFYEPINLGAQQGGARLSPICLGDLREGKEPRPQCPGCPDREECERKLYPQTKAALGPGCKGKRINGRQKHSLSPQSWRR